MTFSWDDDAGERSDDDDEDEVEEAAGDGEQNELAELVHDGTVSVRGLAAMQSIFALWPCCADCAQLQLFSLLVLELLLLQPHELCSIALAFRLFEPLVPFWAADWLRLSACGWLSVKDLGEAVDRFAEDVDDEDTDESDSFLDSFCACAFFNLSLFSRFCLRHLALRFLNHTWRLRKKKEV